MIVEKRIMKPQKIYGKTARGKTIGLSYDGLTRLGLYDEKHLEVNYIIDDIDGSVSIVITPSQIGKER